MNDSLSASLQKENPSVATDKISDRGISETPLRYGKKTKSEKKNNSREAQVAIGKSKKSSAGEKKQKSGKAPSKARAGKRAIPSRSKKIKKEARIRKTGNTRGIPVMKPKYPGRTVALYSPYSIPEVEERIIAAGKRSSSSHRGIREARANAGLNGMLALIEGFNRQLRICEMAERERD